MTQDIQKHIETLEALVAAGEKATQGEMELAWEDGKHGVMAARTGGLTLFVALIGNDGGERNDERRSNAEFYTQSANARPALRAVLDYVRELEALTKRQGEAFKKMQSRDTKRLEENADLYLENAKLRKDVERLRGIVERHHAWHQEPKDCIDQKSGMIWCLAEAYEDGSALCEDTCAALEETAQEKE